MIVKCSAELVPTSAGVALKQNDLAEWVAKVPESARIFVERNQLIAEWTEQK